MQRQRHIQRHIQRQREGRAVSKQQRHPGLSSQSPARLCPMPAPATRHMGPLLHTALQTERRMHTHPPLRPHPLARQSQQMQPAAMLVMMMAMATTVVAMVMMVRRDSSHQHHHARQPNRSRRHQLGPQSQQRPVRMATPPITRHTNTATATATPPLAVPATVAMGSALMEMQGRVMCHLAPSRRRARPHAQSQSRHRQQRHSSLLLLTPTAPLRLVLWLTRQALRQRRPCARQRLLQLRQW